MKQILVLVLIVSTGSAHAEMYRCAGADGTTTYSQTPCAASAEKVAIGSSRTARATADCEFAGHFIRSTTRFMRQGVDKDRLVAEFGGPGAFGDGATRIVDYLYQYESTRGVTAEQIAELGVAQCRSGAFGAVDCKSLPAAYSESGGGCGESFSARRADYSVNVFAIHQAKAEERRQATAALRKQQAEQRRKDYEALERGTQCRDKIELEIFRIEGRIRAGADPNRYSRELKDLRADLSKCGPARSRPYVAPQPGGYLRRKRL